MNKLRRDWIAGVMIAALMSLSLPVRADFVGTEHMLEQQTRAASLNTVQTFLGRDEVSAQLLSWGVEPSAVAERVAALSDAELQELASNMNTDPAGGVLVALGIVLVVMIVLELLGVINIFSRV
ncbi:MAG: PA2779 family protein [Pseudomonadota bacterium]|nr:PA2779 family protein [Pseudomonadota bacterium]